VLLICCILIIERRKETMQLLLLLSLLFASSSAVMGFSYKPMTNNIRHVHVAMKSNNEDKIFNPMPFMQNEVKKEQNHNGLAAVGVATAALSLSLPEYVQAAEIPSAIPSALAAYGYHHYHHYHHHHYYYYHNQDTI